MEDVHHSIDLDLEYVPKMVRGTLHLIFEDGTDYTIQEALHISREEIAGADLRALHMIKRAIRGTLLPDRGLRPSTPAQRRRAVIRRER